MTHHDDGLERDVPGVNLRSAAVLMLVLTIAAIAGYEAYWRAHWYDPHPNKTKGLWAIQRRAASRQANPLVIIGSSRILFDANLDVWEDLAGERPIQLALEGTSPRVVLKHLANDTTFSGRVLVGVTPPLFFFSEGGFGAAAIPYTDKESPSEWLGQQIGMRLEQRLAFIEKDNLPLFRQLEYISMYNREGVSPPHMKVHKLAVADADRNTHMWRRVEEDTVYRNQARDIWVRVIERMSRPDTTSPPFELQSVLDSVKEHVDKIRSRGGDVVFVRCPSVAAWREFERNATPRETFWDVLLDYTKAGGVHFEDNVGLQGHDIPEWSHLSAASAKKFTVALVPLVQRAFETRSPVKDQPAVSAISVSEESP